MSMQVQDRTPERVGPYRLLRRLGEGGMGVVYLAADAAEQLVAVKVLRPVLAEEGNARRRLAREVETMRRVRSRYVAEVVDADVDCEPPYIVTRYVPGLTLDAIVSESGPLTGAALAKLARGLAQALEAIHAAGVVHRDLKPGNVMIADGEPVVIDFGIAQLPETTRLTMTGMFMGTPGYLAPEVIEGTNSGAAADVHSWGATLAFAATGRPPFGTGAFETIFYRIMHGEPDLDTLPATLRPLVVRSLSRNPFARPSAAELKQWAAGLDPASLVPSPATRSSGAAQAGAGRGIADTRADQPGMLARPPSAGSPPAGSLPVGSHSTRPLNTVGSSDVRDLLPPVRYDVPGRPAVAPLAPGSGQAGAGHRAAGPAWPVAGGKGQPGDSGAPGWPGGQGSSPAGLTAGQQGAAAAKLVSVWSPLVIAVIAVAVAASVLAPIIGTGVALGFLVALRAAGITGRRLARRRPDGGGRVGGPARAIAFYPLAVLRALIGLVLLAPVGLLGFGIAAAITIIAVPVHPLPQAVAFGAGALVAVVGLGPGSASSRVMLARFFGTVARTPSRKAIAYLGVLALAAGASLTAFAQPAAYWPASSLHFQLLHLPTVHSMLFDLRLNLLRLARRFGL
jgi:serine/threonine protein kinase